MTLRKTMWYSGNPSAQGDLTDAYWQPTALAYEVLEYCAANGWMLSWSTSPDQLGNYTNKAAMIANPTVHASPNRIETEVLPLINACEDYGVKCIIEIEMCVGGNPGTAPPIVRAVTSSGYDEYYGDTFSLLESQSALDGYGYELGWDNAVEWVRNNTAKWVTCYWASEMNGASWNVPNGYAYPVPTGIDPQWDSPHDLDWRLALVDSVVYESYETNCMPQAIPLFQYLIANYPDMPFGMCTNVNWDDASPNMTIWRPAIDWPNGWGGPMDRLTEAECKRTALLYLYQLKAATAPFTEIRLWAPQVFAGAGEFAKQAEWELSLPLYSEVDTINLSNIAYPT